MVSSDIEYYTAGNKELAIETPLTLERLEPRRKLTKTKTRTVIVLVGLPARGKSFVARKLLHFFNWSGVHCKVFNVGRYRREAYAELLRVTAATEREQQGACDASFFDASNEKASELREKVAECALRDMLRWLDDEDENGSDEDTAKPISDASRNSNSSSASGDINFKHHERVAIFDATNSTDKRRNWILEQCTSPSLRGDKQTGLVFVESICDDVELLEENYRYKVSSSPDFVGMPLEDALADLRMRVAKYEAQYESITDDSLSYIKIFNLSTKLMLNHIYGRMAKDLVPALMAWHIGTRPIYLCRPGQTISGILTDGEDYVNRQAMDEAQLQDIYKSLHKCGGIRGDTLGPNGKCFRQDLFDFLREESHAFMTRRASVRDMAKTGTSISGLAPSQHSLARQDSLQEMGNYEPFPLRIYTSTMPRAADTVSWDDFKVNQRSNLNPLDKGDFAGMELDEIRRMNPTWYKKLERDPYKTRFPGGESYRDLMSRVSGAVIDIEQEVIPTLVVSHVSILQCLMAYFRNTRVEKCMNIEVPLHTVIKFTPVRGGGWQESQHPFYDVVLEENTGGGAGMGPQYDSMGDMSRLADDMTSVSESCSSLPIWGDSIMASPRPTRPPLIKRITH